MSILELIAKEGPMQGYMEAQKFQEESKARGIANLYNSTLAEKNMYDLSKAKERDRSAEEIAKEADATKKRQLREMFVMRYPEEAKKQADAINAMTTEQVAIEKAKNERADALLRGVEEAPANVKEQAYQKALDEAKKEGFDVAPFAKTYAELKSSGQDVLIKAASVTRQQMMENRIKQQQANASTTTAAASIMNARTNAEVHRENVETRKEANRIKLLDTLGKGTEKDTEISDILRKKDPTVTTGAPTKSKLDDAKVLQKDLMDELKLSNYGILLTSSDEKRMRSELSRVTEQAGKLGNGDQNFIQKAATAKMLSNIDENNKIKFSTEPKYDNPKYVSVFGKAIVKTKNGYEILYEKYDNLPEAARHERLKAVMPQDALLLGDLGTLTLNMNNPKHKQMLEEAQSKGLPLIGAKDLTSKHEELQQRLKSLRSGKGTMKPEDKLNLYRRIKEEF